MSRSLPWRRARTVLCVTTLLIAGSAESASATPDYDADGYVSGDCRPLDPTVHPGAPDLPDAAYEDSNCDRIDGDAAHAIFVATDANGGRNDNPGTAAAPVRTLQRALALAARGKDVYVAAGTYPKLTVTAETVDARRGIIIAGGYSPGTWSRPSAVPTNIVGSPEAVLIDGARRVLFQQLSLYGVSGGGSSRYGVRAINNAAIALERVLTRAEDGASGSAGESFSGTRSADGTRGTRGGDGDCDGSSGASGPGGPGGLGGGDGGSGVRGRNGNPGAWGGGAFTGVDGRGAYGEWGRPGAGGAEHNEPGRPGGAGNPGAYGYPGAPGVAASNTLGAAATTWAAPEPNTAGGAHTGTPGTAGGGGGGGGAGGGEDETINAFDGTGAGGGGGGGGGYAGRAGEPGRTGGGSFGVYLATSAALVIAGSDVRAGRGGRGGDGGGGQAGGIGADGGDGGQPIDGCADEVGPGGHGGRGGDGGGGGDGGSGAGGPSIGIFGIRSVAVRLDSPIPTTAGGGAGGRGAPSGQSYGERFEGDPTQVPDFDGDGVIDASDSCPTRPGGTGVACASRPAALRDLDRDGIPDGFDACRDVRAGDRDANQDGCPDDVDADGDGYFAGSQDCRDDNSAINIGAQEVPQNGLDETCDQVDGPFPSVPTRISIQYRAVSGAVVARSVLARRVLAGTVLEIRCSGGRSCPIRRKRVVVARDATTVSLTRHLRKAKLRRGVVLEVRATKAEMLGRVRRDRVGKGRVRPTSLCLDPRRVGQRVGFVDVRLKPRAPRVGEDCG